MIRSLLAAVAAVLALGTAARAHHHQTPPLVQLTTAGDATLPRLPSFGDAVTTALPIDAHDVVVLFHQLFILRPKLRAQRSTFTTINGVGNNDGPVSAFFGFGERVSRRTRQPAVVVWDSDGQFVGTDPGRQVYVSEKGVIRELSNDPTGTSVDAALNGDGTLAAFESSGDLAGTGDATPQIFTVTLPVVKFGLPVDDGSDPKTAAVLRAAARGGRGSGTRQQDRHSIGPVTQLSRGAGTSRHAAIDAAGDVVVYDSTSDPKTGADGGVAQILVADRAAGSVEAITAGQGPSVRPSISADGRFVAFESRADLAGTGADTGVSQVFLYDRTSRDTAQLSDDPLGCGGAAVNASEAEWHATFTCHGLGYVYLPVADQIGRVPVVVGDVNALLPEAGRHFVVVSTTATCRDCGTETARFDVDTTLEHRLYLWNLFKLPPVATDLTARWFPSRPALR